MRTSSSRRLMLLTPLLEVQAAAMFILEEADACPGCPTGRAVRDLVFGDGFWLTLGLISLPLLALLGICALLFRVGLARPVRSSTGSITVPLRPVTARSITTPGVTERSNDNREVMS